MNNPQAVAHRTLQHWVVTKGRGGGVCFVHERSVVTFSSMWFRQSPSASPGEQLVESTHAVTYREDSPRLQYRRPAYLVPRTDENP